MVYISCIDTFSWNEIIGTKYWHVRTLCWCVVMNLYLRINSFAWPSLQCVSTVWWFLLQPNKVECVEVPIWPVARSRSTRFLACIVIELTPLCGMWLQYQPLNTWQTFCSVLFILIYNVWCCVLVWHLYDQFFILCKNHPKIKAQLVLNEVLWHHIGHYPHASMYYTIK